MAPGSASDPDSQPESDGHNPTIPELVSPLRDSFQTADFDRAEKALILREANLKKQNQILRESAELQRLETLKLADELNALKKRPPQTDVSDEVKKVIRQLRKEKSRLEKEKSFLEQERSILEREGEGLERRILVLEDKIRETDLGSSVREDHRHSGSVVNLEKVYESLIAIKENGNLQNSGKSKLDKVIDKQKEEYAKLEKEHKFEMQKKQKVENEYAVLQSKYQVQLKEKVRVENELKDCQGEIEKLKEEINVMAEKHRNESGDIEHKHQINSLEMLKVQNEVTLLKEERKLLEENHRRKYKALEQKHQSDRLEMCNVEKGLKVCKGALGELKQEQKLLEEKHKIDYKVLEQKYQYHLLEVENELKHCKAELKGLKEEKHISNEKNEKLLEEVNKHRKDEDELGNFESLKTEEVKNEIPRLEKLLNNVIKNTLLKNNGMIDASRNQKCVESPKHVIDVEDLCDSVPGNVSPQRKAGGKSEFDMSPIPGASKSSYIEPILLSDSDDDCAPAETEFFGLKRKRASSPNVSDNNNCGHNFEQENFVTAENKQRRMLGRCDYGEQNNPSSRDQEIPKQRSSIESPAQVKDELDSSSESIFSSDDSQDDDDINLESTIMSITNRA